MHLKPLLASWVLSLVAIPFTQTAHAYENPNWDPKFDTLWNAYYPGGIYLFPGQRLQSAGCGFTLVMRSDGDLALYGGPNNASIYWETHTYPNQSGEFKYAEFRGDSNFVIYSSNAVRPIWESGAQRSADRIIMQSDGNLVAYDPYPWHATWWSGTDGRVPFTTPYCVWTSEATYLTKNHMINGYWYNLTSQPSAQACANLCVQDRAGGCVAFSWYAQAAGVVTAHSCFLRKGITQEYDEDGVVSGFIRGRQAQPG